MSVAPAQSIVVTGPDSGPGPPLARTSLMRSSSTITVALSIGSAPVQSIRNAFVNAVMLICGDLPGSARTAGGERSARAAPYGYRATTLASYIHTFSSARGVHSTD